MYPDRGIVHTYRQSDGLSTRPDGPNTLTRQSACTNDAPRYPASLPHYVESCPRHVPIYVYIYNYIYILGISIVFVIVTSTLPRSDPAHCHILSAAMIAVIIGSFTLFNSSNLIRLKFFDWI